jgi:hypothetical protein
MVQGCVVGEGFVGDFGDDLTVVEHAHGIFRDDAANLDGVKTPFLEDAEDFFMRSCDSLSMIS